MRYTGSHQTRGPWDLSAGLTVVRAAALLVLGIYTVAEGLTFNPVRPEDDADKRGRISMGAMMLTGAAAVVFVSVRRRARPSYRVSPVAAAALAGAAVSLLEWVVFGLGSRVRSLR